MPNTAKVVIVRDLREAIAALTIATELSAPVILQNPEGSLQFAGSLYFLEMFKGALAAVPKANARYILDCGDAAGLATAALADGHRHIRLQASPEMNAKITDIAGAYNAKICCDAVEILDLSRQNDIKAALKDWLLCD